MIRTELEVLSLPQLRELAKVFPIKLAWPKSITKEDAVTALLPCFAAPIPLGPLAKHIEVKIGSETRVACKACLGKLSLPAETMSESAYQEIVGAFNQKHAVCVLTDQARIKNSTEPFIWICGRKNTTGKWDLNTCTHFELTDGRTKMWCTHGAWEATLMYDDNGNLTMLKVTQTKESFPIGDYQLTVKGSGYKPTMG